MAFAKRRWWRPFSDRAKPQPVPALPVCRHDVVRVLDEDLHVCEACRSVLQPTDLGGALADAMRAVFQRRMH